MASGWPVIIVPCSYLGYDIFVTGTKRGWRLTTWGAERLVRRVTEATAPSECPTCGGNGIIGTAARDCTDAWHAVSSRTPTEKPR